MTTTTMTRQHFQLIAEVLDEFDIHLSPSPATSEALVEMFADRLAETNPNFDRERFITAATGRLVGTEGAAAKGEKR